MQPISSLMATIGVIRLARRFHISVRGETGETPKEQGNFHFDAV